MAISTSVALLTQLAPLLIPAARLIAEQLKNQPDDVLPRGERRRLLAEAKKAEDDWASLLPPPE
jgi:hypothetical protein